MTINKDRKCIVINNKAGEFTLCHKDYNRNSNGVLQSSYEFSDDAGRKQMVYFRDIQTMRGNKVIALGEYGDVVEHLKKSGMGTPLAMRIDEQQFEYLMNIEKEQYDALVRRAAEKSVKKLRWAQGGDTHELYFTTDELSYEEKSVREDLNDITHRAKKFLSRRDIEEQSTALPSDFRTGLYTTDGWHEIDYEIVKELVEVEQSKVDAAVSERKKERNAIFAEARETGKCQILSSHIVECEDNDEDCSADIITHYATPDGTEKSVRKHTW